MPYLSLEVGELETNCYLFYSTKPAAAALSSIPAPKRRRSWR